MAELNALRTPSKSPLKARSLSDSTPKLAPSPTLHEKSQSRHVSQDDHAVPSSVFATASAFPNTPSRIARPPPPSGLHLHMPRRDSAPQSPSWRPPLSPKMERNNSIYTSPGSVLPRRSRGLDFSRAATHLHHSTLAEQPSPDTSPAMLQRPMAIPPRKRSMNAMSIDPPSFGSHYERNTISSSLGSVNMLGSDESSSEDDLELMDHDEPEDHILNTPHLHSKSPSVSLSTNPTPGMWPNFFHQPGVNFTGFRRSKLRQGEGRSRHSSSSASGHSNVHSPVPTSPGGKTADPSYFPSTAFRRPPSRRESISKVTNELNISSGNDSGDEGGLPGPSTPGVIRRPVSRRGNLYPKSRAFGRIKAELIEESAPVESEVRREAEVIRQVRESDIVPSSTAMSSPSLQPIIQGLEGIPEDPSAMLGLDSLGSSEIGRLGRGAGFFAQIARSSGTKEFWDSMSDKMTPPPVPLNMRNSSIGEDMIVDSPLVSQSSSAFSTFFPHNYAISEPSRSSTPQPSIAPDQQSNNQTTPQPPTAADGLRKSTKRRRDDDLDITNWKRRAVSPGLSVTNSPILSQSPSQRANSTASVADLWDRALQQHQSQTGQLGTARKERERGNSVSSVVSTTPAGGNHKRVGMQGMNDMQGLTEKMTLE